MNKKRDGKVRRLNNCNELLVFISNHGRNFFRHDGRVARFELSKNGRVQFVDELHNKKVDIYAKGGWRHFSHGGGLRQLIEDLRDHIRTGDRYAYFGPWPDWYSGGDPWGYGEDMKLVLEEAKRLGVAR
jgi:hypothetical protein